ncbi:MAG: hypothetical protein Q4B40_07295, partial [Clostridia bacterium]|nr:hypothetical protein [Clostridia bacterium]
MLFAGCSVFKKVDVVGEYEYAAWSVSINDDSTYHVYETDTEETIKKGNWSYNSSKSILTFEEFLENGENIYFIENNNNFILFSQEDNKPYYYDELSVESGDVLDFTYEFNSLDLKFYATGDIEVSGDNYEYGDGSYEIKDKKVYAYFSYTTVSARNYVDRELYFYIYDKDHLIPYNYIMIKE